MTNIFDAKGVFMRALKTQERVIPSLGNSLKLPPKTITVKRNSNTNQNQNTESGTTAITAQIISTGTGSVLVNLLSLKE